MSLASPNHPKWYFADELGCDWLLTAPDGNIVALEFNSFEVSTKPVDCKILKKGILDQIFDHLHIIDLPRSFLITQIMIQQKISKNTIFDLRYLFRS